MMVIMALTILFFVSLYEGWTGCKTTPMWIMIWLSISSVGYFLGLGFKILREAI